MAEQHAIGCKGSMNSSKQYDNLEIIPFNELNFYIYKDDMKFIEEIVIQERF